MNIKQHIKPPAKNGIRASMIIMWRSCTICIPKESIPHERFIAKSSCSKEKY